MLVSKSSYRPADARRFRLLASPVCTMKASILAIFAIFAVGIAPLCARTLHEAANMHDVDRVCVMVQAGADVNAKDEFGMTPFDRAEKYSGSNSLPALATLSELCAVMGAKPAGCDGYAYDPHNPSRLRLQDWNAYASGDLEDCGRFDWLLDISGEQMANAVRAGDTRKVERLIEAGADLTFPFDGYQPLELALASSRHDENAHIVRLLIEGGSHVNTMSMNNCQTPLHRAGSVAAVSLLIEAGADLNSRECSYGGWTPLHFAVQNANLEKVQLLIDAGAGVNDKDDHGNTPLEDAMSLGIEDIAKLLRNAGANE